MEPFQHLSEITCSTSFDSALFLAFSYSIQEDLLNSMTWWRKLTYGSSVAIGTWNFLAQPYQMYNLLEGSTANLPSLSPRYVCMFLVLCFLYVRFSVEMTFHCSFVALDLWGKGAMENKYSTGNSHIYMKSDSIIIHKQLE